MLGLIVTMIITYLFGFVTAVGFHNKWCQWRKDYEKLKTSIDLKKKEEFS